MMSHEAIGGDAEAGPGVSPSENLFERGVVSGSLKQLSTPFLAFEVSAIPRKR